MKMPNIRQKPASLLPLLLLALAVSTVQPAVAASDDDPIVFGAQAWPGATIKTEIAQQILEQIGYKTEVTNGTSPVLSVGMRRGDIDVMLENWMPDMKKIIQENLDSGKVVQLAVNIDDARLDLVVPQYVWDAGIHSIADLNKHADAFNHKILGIEAGNVDNQIVQKAIDDNTYNLGDWELMPSSTAAMMVQVGKRAADHKKVVFIGWRPHWMNIEYDLKYLEDPEGLFSDTSRVLTLANAKFIKNNPNVAKFLKQFKQDAAMESDWIYDFGYEKRTKSKVASQWLKSHPEIVNKWLEGVTTADGRQKAKRAMK